MPTFNTKIGAFYTKIGAFYTKIGTLNTEIGTMDFTNYGKQSTSAILVFKTAVLPGANTNISRLWTLDFGPWTSFLSFPSYPTRPPLPGSSP